MATEKNLVTNARLSEIKTAEAGLADNLYEHANASLSKAHGIQLYYLPHPFYDDYGNDVSSYCDSGGDRVGYYQGIFTYSNVNYYVPLEVTTLTGKDPDTGMSLLHETDTATPSSAPSETALVTDFTPQDQQDLIVTNNDVLLPHLLLSHWETHEAGVYQITAQDTYDSAGHKIGDYVVTLSVDGNELNLPCSSRLGGPVQPPRNVAIAPTSIAWAFASGEGYEGGSTCTATWTGSAPFTSIRWQLLQSGSVWSYLTNANGSSAGSLTSYDGRLNIAGYCTVDLNSFTSLFTFTSVGTLVGSNVGQLRVEITNSEGTSYAYCLLSATDETSSCVVFSSGVESGLLGFSNFRTALHYRLQVNQFEFLGDQVWGGYMVLGNRLKPHILKRTRLGRFACKYVLPHVAEGMKWRMGKSKPNLYSVVIGYTYMAACLVAYLFNKNEADSHIKTVSKHSLMSLYHKHLKRIRKKSVKE